MEISVDTNILLIHSFSAFEGGRLLDRVWPRDIIAPSEAEQFTAWLDRVLTSNELVTTPQALLEFKHTAQSRANLDTRGLAGFLSSYSEVLAKVTEEHTVMRDILSYERDHNAWWLCLTDTSLALRVVL